MDYFDPMGRQDARESFAAIRVGVKPGPDAAQARWSLTLVIFMRMVSLLWIVQGLINGNRSSNPPLDIFSTCRGRRSRRRRFSPSSTWSRRSASG